MAKGPYLTPKVNDLIAEIYRKDRQIKAPKARELLLKRMKAEGLDEIFGPNFPGVSTVSNKLKEYRDKDEARSPESKELDKPWTIGSLAKYPIPPEALPLVISTYEKCLLEAFSEDWKVSIREALWIGRLYKILEIYHARHVIPFRNAEEEALVLKLGHRPEGYQGTKLEDVILDWAYTYAGYEELSEIEGEPLFDSGELDGYLMSNVFDYYGERRADAIYSIAEQYDADQYILEQLKLPIGDIELIADFFGKREFRTFAVPEAEMNKICDEEQDFKRLRLGIRDDLVIMALGEDASERVLGKLANYQTFYSKEAQEQLRRLNQRLLEALEAKEMKKKGGKKETKNERKHKAKKQK